ncbi:MAG TPA: Ig-like domain-containing protein, partial [Candidatus Bathyarchaeia archaeon]|nr:Ig-like domain-containing protein [Candidatus Bathyarchaeia archaeon]
GRKLLDPSTDTTPPTVSITAPSVGSAVSARVWVSAAASDASGIAGVQFQMDGRNIDVEDTIAPFDVSWDTATATAGTHRLTAIARDASGNRAASAGVTVSVGGGDTTPPVISAVTVSGVGTSSATITWTTNEPATSRTVYGRTNLYSLASSLDTTLATSHSMTLTGLRAGTTYFYRVRSMDAAGNRGVSAEGTFTTTGSPGGTATATAVTWSGLVNTTALGGTLTKTGGGEGVDDARAASSQQIDSAEGALEFVAGDIATIRFAALSRTGGQGWEAMDFAVRLGPWSATSGLAEVREKGAWRADTGYVTGDKFRIAVDSGVVRYFKNGALFHTSTTAPAFPLRGDASILGLGGKIGGATITRP